MFGELSFFTNLQRQTGARSVNFSTVFTIKQSDFLTILEKYPHDYVYFLLIY